MSKKHAVASQLQQGLKNLMRQQRFTFVDLADRFSVSLSTAKRWLNSPDPSLSKLVGICEWLGLEFHELVEIMAKARQSYHYCTLDQETFLATHMGHFAVLRLLQKGTSLAVIRKENGLSQVDVDAYIQDLSDHKFLTHSVEGLIQLQVRDGMDWRPDGPLRKSLMDKLLREMLESYLQNQQDEKHSFLDFGHKVLSESRFQEFRQELDDLSRKYGALSRIEPKLHGAERVKTYSYLLLCDGRMSPAWKVPPYS